MAAGKQRGTQVIRLKDLVNVTIGVSLVLWLGGVYSLYAGVIRGDDIPSILSTLLTVQGVLIGLFGVFVSFFLFVFLEIGKKNLFKEMSMIKKLGWGHVVPVILILGVAVSSYSILGVSVIVVLRFPAYALGTGLFYATLILFARTLLFSLATAWDASDPITQEIIDENELKDWIDLSWKFVGKLPSGKVVVEGTHTESTKAKKQPHQIP